jgi:hypothetical protein
MLDVSFCKKHVTISLLLSLHMFISYMCFGTNAECAEVQISMKRESAQET